MKLVEVLKALADENRVRILNLLKEGEFCVCNIDETLGLSQSNTSRHMNKLKNVGIVESRKEAQWVHYKLKDDLFENYPFLKELLNSFKMEKQLNEDLEKFNKVKKCKRG